MKKHNILLKKIYYTRLVPIVFSILIVIYGFFNMKNVVRTEYDVDASSKELDSNYKIALVSDLHFGTSLTLEELNNYIDKISNENPDIVILAGDIIDRNTNKNDVEQLFNVLGKFKSKYGTYFVYGNHDLENLDKSKLENILINSGIKILNDSSVGINNDLVLMGRQDKSINRNRVSLSDLFKNIDSNKEIVLIDHQPGDYKNAENLGVDVILSGHTHAGQVWPIGFIMNLFANENRMVYGYEKSGSLNKIVTSGIAGWGYTVRTEKNSEYVIININK